MTTSFNYTACLWKLNSVSLKDSKGKTRIGVDCLDILQGITAIIGESGSGKTSLMNLLCAFEKPDSGSIQEFIPQKQGKLKLFWSPHNGGLWPFMTAIEHINAVMPENVNYSAIEMLECFDIADKEKKFPGELSRGECSRLSIARSLAADPSVVLMDEPLVNIDYPRRQKYWEKILSFIKKENIYLVYTSHTPEQVENCAEKIIFVDNGKILFNGSMQDLNNNDLFEKIQLYLRRKM